jgi:enoyl-CoA hydratase
MSFVSYDVDEAGIALLTINRVDKLNALSVAVMDDLEAAFLRARDDARVKAVVLTGAGEKAFVAGADIGQFTHLNALTGEVFARRGQQVFDAIEGMPKVVIAAVNGFALGGGCELAMACHLRVASENARFAQPEVNLGILPGYGGTQRLPRLIGRGRALEMILTGDFVSAQRAYEMGLANMVVPAGEAVTAAKTLARKIAGKAPRAIEASLRAVYAADGTQAQGQAFEAALFGQTSATEDLKEGASAFLNKRPPSWTGR